MTEKGEYVNRAEFLQLGFFVLFVFMALWFLRGVPEVPYVQQPGGGVAIRIYDDNDRGMGVVAIVYLAVLLLLARLMRPGR